MATSFDERTRDLLDGRNFATVATINPNGSPQTSLVWYKRDGDAVVFSTLASRRKARNIARDPRVSVTVFDLEMPQHSVDIHGTAETTVDEEKAMFRELALRYLGEVPAFEEPAEVVRLTVRVVPTKVTGFWG